MWIKNRINQFRIRQRKKRNYNFFLNNLTNINLKDNLNSMRENRDVPLCILGNGDSLRESIDKLDRNNDFMVLNGAVCSPFYQDLRPKYYSLADPGFFYEGKSFDGISIVKKILSDTRWKMFLFVPWEHTKNVDWLKSNEFVTVVTVNQSLYCGPEEYRSYCYEHNLAMPNVCNVLASCLYEGIYLGYREIKIFGCEHSWTKSLYVGNDNLVYLHDSHFYEDNVLDSVMKNSDGESMKIHEVLRMYSDMFKTYWEIRNLADRKGVKILNCSPNSFIDAFDRVLSCKKD